MKIEGFSLSFKYKDYLGSMSFKKLTFVTNFIDIPYVPPSPTSNRIEGLYDVQAEADQEFGMTVGKDVEMFTKLGVIVDFDGTISYLARTPGK